MPNLTLAVGEFAADVGPFPEAALRAAQIGVIDVVGVMLAGSREPVVDAVLATVADADGRGPSRLLLTDRTAASDTAAFVNATAAHALAMDDVAGGCHPSASLVPALLAEGEALGASGTELLRAYVVGFEVLVELARREPDALHATGWHPTGLIGPVAAAAAVASLRRLDAARCTHAIGIAASMAGGLQANFGTQTKALHLGRVAHAGVLAARLAAAGVTSACDALEHPKGLLRTVSPNGRVDVDRPFAVDRANPRVLTIGLGIKKYPVCYTTHRVVDAAIGLAVAHDLTAGQIVKVSVRIGRGQAAMARHHAPRTVLEAKYSVEFAVAAGLIARSAGFAELDPTFIEAPEVRDLMGRVALELLDARSDDDAVFAPTDRVTVALRDGRVLNSGDVPFARGHAALPLGADDLRRKFVDCARTGGRDDGDSLHAQLTGLATIADLRTLGRRSLSPR